MRMWAVVIHVSAEVTDFSKSLANLRHRPSHAKVRSMTKRRGRIAKPLALSERPMISERRCDPLLAGMDWKGSARPRSGGPR
jgi:hypothetical protein